MAKATYPKYTAFLRSAVVALRRSASKRPPVGARKILHHEGDGERSSTRIDQEPAAIGTDTTPGFYTIYIPPSRDIYEMYKYDREYTICMGSAQSNYGRFEVTNQDKNRTFAKSRTAYFVEDRDGHAVEIGTGKNGKKRARTLAATLNAASIYSFEDVLPPGLLDGDFPSKGASDPWQEWASDTDAIPARIATSGKAPMAGWLHIIHRERPSWIANELGVSEQTVRQYLSDLREGRR